MLPFGLTTIVDLAPRLVLPFSPQTAVCLEAMGVLVVSALGLLHAAWRHRSLDSALAVPARRPSARVIPLRRAERAA